jgi:large subunit ribosomal protein L35
VRTPSTSRDKVSLMPKMKTHKATAKRFRVTGKGRLRQRKQGSSHLKRKKSKRSRREMRRDVKTDPVNVKRIERLLGRRFRRS